MKAFFGKLLSKSEPRTWASEKSRYWSLLESQQIQDAYVFMGKLESLAVSPEQKSELGELWWHVGKWGAWTSQLAIAEASLTKSLQYDPGRLEAWNELVNVKYYLGRLKEAEACARDMQQWRKKAAAEMQIDIEHNIYFSLRWTKAIGHLAALCWWVKALKLGLMPQVKMHLVRQPDQIANRVLFELIAPFFNVISDPLEIAKIEEHALVYQDSPFLMRMRTGMESVYRSIPLIETEWEKGGSGALLQLAPEQIEKCQASLREFGLAPDVPFICLHVRESATYDQAGSQHAALRNSRVEDYDLAIDEALGRGISVFRMGDAKMTKARPRAGLVDYAHSPLKSPEMDIYLFSHCKFLISTVSGPAVIPRLFGRRTLHTNLSPLGVVPPYPGDLFVPREIYDNRRKRILSVEEILASPIGWGENQSILASADCTIIPNKPEVLRDAVNDMLFETESNELRKPSAKLLAAFGAHGFSYVPPVSPSFEEKLIIR